MRGILINQTPKAYQSPITAPYIRNIEINDWKEEEGTGVIYYTIKNNDDNTNIIQHNRGSQLFIHFYVYDTDAKVYKMTHGLPVKIGHIIKCDDEGNVRIEVSEKVNGKIVILGFVNDVLGGNA